MITVTDKYGNIKETTEGGGGTQYTDGEAAPAHPIGTAIAFDDAGTIKTVSDTQPLPVAAVIDTGDLATSDNQTSGAQKTQIVDAGGEVATVTGGKLDVNASVDTTGLATSAIQTDGTQKSQIVDAGGEAVTVTGGKLDVNASFTPSGTQDVNVVGESVGLALAANQQTDALTDTELRATPVPISGTVTVNQGTQGIAAWPVLAAQAGTWDIRNVSGTVSLPTLAATSTKQSDGTQKTQVVDGSGNVIASTSNALNVNVSSGSITPSGTQDVNITKVAGAAIAQGHGTAATAIRVELPTDGTGVIATVGAVTAITNALPAGNNNIGDVDIATMPAITGTVTANAGTNLNTSLLALETTQTSIKNAVEIMDDWDESDRAKVNLIVGQAGVDGNSGNKSAATVRVVLATDQPALTNALQVKSTQKPSYGATTVMTVTNLQSKTSSATAGWQSDRVSNLSTLATDYEIFVKLTTANTAPANDKAMYVYICPFYTTDGGSTWFPASQGTTTLPTGTEGTTTIASPNNLRLLGVLNYSTAQAVVQDTFLLSNCFGNRLPDAFSIIIINFSGATLSTGCVVDFSPINDVLV